jgi:hypothetical protein
VTAAPLAWTKKLPVKGIRGINAAMAHVSKAITTSSLERLAPVTPSIRHVCPLTHVNLWLNGEGPMISMLPKSKPNSYDFKQSEVLLVSSVRLVAVEHQHKRYSPPFALVLSEPHEKLVP